MQQRVAYQTMSHRIRTTQDARNRSAAGSHAAGSRRDRDHETGIVPSSNAVARSLDEEHEEMQDPSSTIRPAGCDEFDYSTPEAQKALSAALDLVLEIREEQAGPLARKTALYERTLGLAVIPVLLRRAIIVLARRINAGRRGHR